MTPGRSAFPSRWHHSTWQGHRLPEGELRLWCALLEQALIRTSASLGPADWAREAIGNSASPMLQSSHKAGCWAKQAAQLFLQHLLCCLGWWGGRGLPFRHIWGGGCLKITGQSQDDLPFFPLQQLPPPSGWVSHDVSLGFVVKERFDKVLTSYCII